MEMCSEIFLCIPGKPIAKKTHREEVRVNWGKRTVKRWRRSPQTEEVAQTRALMQAQYKGKPIDYGVFILFEFFVPIPEKWTKKIKEKALSGELYPLAKPDSSNYAKYYEDCMKGIVIEDDCKAVWISPSKHFAKNNDPRTEILIKPFDYETYTLFKHYFGRECTRTQEEVA